MRVLITGLTGFAGSHLAELALAEGADVHGTVLPGSPPPSDLAGLLDRVRPHPCDLTQPGAMARVLAEVKPDRVFHLAGMSVVGSSWANRAEVLRVNVEVTFRLLEALRETPTPCLLVSSAEVYGLVEEASQPIAETTPLRPLSPYALSKACQELYATYYALAERLPVVTVRAFNHIGPRQGPGFVSADLARQVAAIEAGRVPPVLAVGNTSARRDFTDVRDMVRAYWLALEKGLPGEAYNAASGTAVSVREVLEIFRALARVPFEVREDPSRFRPVDLPLLLGDAGKLRAATGWAPAIPLRTSLADTLADWRRRG